MATGAVIYYFSGTGNAELSAKSFQRQFQAVGTGCDLIRMEDVLKGKVRSEPGKYDPLGFGYCIHAFNAPRIVYDFIERLPPGEGRKVFLFKCPGDGFLQAGATSMIRGRLNEKGYAVFHETLLVTPANVLIRIDDGLAKRLYAVGERKIRKSCVEILAGKTRLQENPLWLAAISRLFSWGETRGARYFGKSLRASGACVRCGRCAENCPTRNIRLVEGKPEFGWDCMLCMRCIYECPARAITAGPLNFFTIRQWRGSSDILADPSVNPKNPKYHRLLTKKVREYAENP
jgi:ferredoxin/flavodoxin